MLALQQYGSSDEEHENDEEKDESPSKESYDLKSEENAEYSVKSQLKICAAPLVVPTVS